MWGGRKGAKEGGKKERECFAIFNFQENKSRGNKFYMPGSAVFILKCKNSLNQSHSNDG